MKRVISVIESVLVLALFFVLFAGRVQAAPDVNTMWLAAGNTIVVGKTASNQTPNNPTINNSSSPENQKDIYFLYCPTGTDYATVSGADLTADSQPGKPNLLFTLSKNGANSSAFDNDATTGSGFTKLAQGTGAYLFTVELVTPSSTNVFQTYSASLSCVKWNDATHTTTTTLPLTFSNTNGTYSAQIRDN